MTSERQPRMSRMVERPTLSVLRSDGIQPAGRVMALALGDAVDGLRSGGGVRFRYAASDLSRGEEIRAEVVHDYRIALRRVELVLRCARGVFPEMRRALALQQVSSELDATARYRDLCVVVQLVEARRPAVSEQLTEGLDTLLAELGLRLDDHRRILSGMFGTDTHNSMMSELRALGVVNRVGGEAAGLSALVPTSTVLDAAMERALRQLGRSARKARRSGLPEDWHRVRVRLKRVRYAMESYSPLFADGVVESSTRRIGRLQSALGDLHDLGVAAREIRSAMSSVGGDPCLAAGSVVDSIYAELPRALTKVEKRWLKLDYRGLRRDLRTRG